MQHQAKTKVIKEKKKNTSERKTKAGTWKEDVHRNAAVRSKIDSFTVTMRSLREMAEKEARLVQCALKDMENNLIDPKHILELTKSIHGTGEQSITEYINRNTEILLNEHASVIRQQVIENMKQQMQEMSDELTLSTQKLENNISNFFDLIETSYKSASDSFHKVIALAQENYEKEEIINKTKDELFLIQSEVQKLEEQLLECLMCYAFLDSLFQLDEDKMKLKLPEDFLKSFGPSVNADEGKLIQKKVLEGLMSSAEIYDPLDVHVQSASEIMKVIDRLKDSNLSLVHNSHLSKGPVKFERKKLDKAKEKMEADLKAYDDKIATVEKEIEKTKNMQEKLQKQLSDMQEEYAKEEILMERENEMKKLIELYNICSGSDAKNVDVFLMKASIDYCLEDLYHELDKHPRKKIKEMLKALETEKKLRERKAEEALRAERLQKKLQRSSKYMNKKI